MRPTFRRERAALKRGVWPVAGCDEAGRGPLAGPVVAAAVSSLPEIGGDAARYVEDPADTPAFATVLAAAIADRPSLAMRGRARAARFTWERCTSGVAVAVSAITGDGRSDGRYWPSMR